MSTAPDDLPSGLQEGVSSLSKAHEELSDILDELESELSASLGQWKSSAHDTYVEVQRSWEASTARQREIVHDIPDLLGTTEDDAGVAGSPDEGDER